MQFNKTSNAEIHIRENEKLFAKCFNLFFMCIPLAMLSECECVYEFVSQNDAKKEKKPNS